MKKGMVCRTVGEVHPPENHSRNDLKERIGDIGRVSALWVLIWGRGILRGP